MRVKKLFAIKVLLSLSLFLCCTVYLYNTSDRGILGYNSTDCKEKTDFDEPTGIGRTGIYVQNVFRAKHNEIQMFFLKDYRNTRVSVEMKVDDSWLPFSFLCYYSVCGGGNGTTAKCGFIDYFAYLEIPEDFEEEFATIRVNISTKEHRLKILDVRSDGTYKHELAVALHPAYYVSDWQMVIQYFESWLAHGATKFYIYHYSWSKKVQQVIDFYQSHLGAGLEVLSWSALPTFHSERGVFDKDPNTLMFNLVAEAALNNALYRSRKVAKYLAVMDLDEIAISPNGFLLDILSKIQVNRSDLASFSLKWVQYSGKVNLLRFDKPSDVKFDYLALIEKVSTRALPDDYYNTYKCIHRPDRSRLIDFHNFIHLEWKNQTAGEPYLGFNMKINDMIAIHLRRIFDFHKVETVDTSGILSTHAKEMQEAFRKRIKGTSFEDKLLSPWVQHHSSILSTLHDCRRSHEPKYKKLGLAIRKCRSVRACEPYLYDPSSFVMADMSWTNIAEPESVLGFAT